MERQLDELSRSLASGVSRRDVLGKLGLGLAAVLLAALGLDQRAEAHPKPCASGADCGRSQLCCNGVCISPDDSNCGCCGCACPAGTHCKRVNSGGSYGHYHYHGYYICV